MAETRKAATRRANDPRWRDLIDETRPGIDIGSGPDPLNAVFRRYDKADGDATYLSDIPAESFWTVYASHVLEHLDHPDIALRNWWRILRPGGVLIVSVPHRDLYEKRTELPSRWNGEHKWFFLPDRAEPPVTLSFYDTLRVIPDHERESILFDVCKDGWVDLGPDRHSVGEYSIEAAVRKRGGLS